MLNLCSYGLNDGYAGLWSERALCVLFCCFCFLRPTNLYSYCDHISSWLILAWNCFSSHWRSCLTFWEVCVSFLSHSSMVEKLFCCFVSRAWEFWRIRLHALPEWSRSRWFKPGVVRKWGRRGGILQRLNRQGYRRIPLPSIILATSQSFWKKDWHSSGKCQFVITLTEA